MKKIPILIYITILITAISSCSKKSGPIQGEVTFITGTLKINTADAIVGSRVSKDDTLITGEKSEAVIQIAETAAITLKSGTEIKFGNLISNSGESAVIEMELNKGNTYHKIIRKGTDYSVKAPTAVASVRGTSFEMTAGEKSTRINVDTGTVYVKKLSSETRTDRTLTDTQRKGEEEIVLTAGQSLEIFSNGSFSGNRKGGETAGTPPAEEKKSTSREGKQKNSRDALAPESKTLSDKKTAVKPGRISSEKTESKKKDTAYTTGRKEGVTTEERKGTAKAEKVEKKPDPEEVKALVKNKERKLEDIKEVYSRIDRVYLYSGDVITGAIIERGETYSIFTTGGIVKVSRKDIQSNEIVK